MKRSAATFFRVLTLALVVACAQGEALSESPLAVRSPGQRFAPPYPFTASQLWGMLTQIVAIPDAAVSSAKLGAIFGVPSGPMPYPQRSSDVVDAYVLRAGYDWYFNVNLYVYANGSSIFSFDTNTIKQIVNLPRATVPVCIGRHTVVATLNNAGWQHVGPSQGISSGEAVESFEFSLRSGRIAAFFPKGGDCLVLLSINRSQRTPNGN
jgi:hypothetical protein